MFYVWDPSLVFSIFLQIFYLITFKYQLILFLEDRFNVQKLKEYDLYFKENLSFNQCLNFLILLTNFKMFDDFFNLYFFVIFQ